MALERTDLSWPPQHGAWANAGVATAPSSPSSPSSPSRWIDATALPCPPRPARIERPHERRVPRNRPGQAQHRSAPSPREACFAFGFQNAGRHAGGRVPPARPTLAPSLAAATGEDCLDAAFSLTVDIDAAQFIAGATTRKTVEPPFDDCAYYGAIARWLGCPFDDGTELSALPGLRRANGAIEFHGSPCGAGLLARVRADGRQLMIVSPSPAWLPNLAALVARNPAATQRIVVAMPRTLHALRAPVGAVEVAGRIEPLHAIAPTLVADRVLTAPQRFATAAALGAAIAAVATLPSLVLPLGILAVTLVLIAYAASRGVAVFGETRYPRRARLKSIALPRYSILLPLHGEAASLPGLVHALRRIDYPPDKLDILFLVEEGDAITRAALAREAADLPSRIVVLPPGKPQTKPRALNAGLRQARGAYVTVFDAEDRPHPGQLRTAAETFAAAPSHVVGLQARLTIDHLGENWLTAMFAIEYACLFERIMPLVAGRDRLVLLGGTSNHFRRDALIACGGWDPYNVTEDADLAVRLRRQGLHLVMIDSYTEEEAPITMHAWLKQRSRWFKGYMQTWLVHSRTPVRFVREVGWRDAALFHVYILGAILAALSHLVFTIQIAAAVFGVYDLFNGAHQWLTAFQVGAVTFGYGTNFAVGALSLDTMRRRGKPLPVSLVLWFPVYWLLMSVAVLIALHDIVRQPHHWRKTAHGLGARPTAFGRAVRRNAPETPPKRRGAG